MVEKFVQILKLIRDQKGEVYLFAILKMDELSDRWSVVLSAPWANDANLGEIFSYLKSLLISKFNEEEMSQIATLGVFTKGEHLIEELLKFKEGTTISEQVQINGNTIHEGHILASNSRL